MHVRHKPLKGIRAHLGETHAVQRLPGPGLPERQPLWIRKAALRSAPTIKLLESYPA